jgi:hypothetical protein
VSGRKPPCSANTGAYCQARKRLPEKFFATVACLVDSTLDAKAEQHWLWKGRRVYMFDGTAVTMPDTPENQADYPQVYNQQPRTGFPIARVGALIALSCGAIVNLGVCRYGYNEGVTAANQQSLGTMRDRFQKAEAAAKSIKQYADPSSDMDVIERVDELLAAIGKVQSQVS